MIDRIPQPTNLTMSVLQFIEMSPLINLNPEAQRPAVEVNSDEKSQSIIASMLSGISVGQITLHEIDGSNTPKKYKYESVDGGHRCRAMIGYRNGKFPLGSQLGKNYEGKFYCQLSEEDREFFDSIELVFTIYDGLLARQLRKVFTTINTSDHINHQEGVNAAGSAAIAKAIRETVRYMGVDIDNTPHMLFEEQNTSSKRKKEPVFMREINRRLSHDRYTARIFCVSLNGSKPTGCDDLEIENMYDREYTENELNSAKSKVKKCLDFVLAIAQVRKSIKSKLSIEDAVMLYRLYFTYTNRYKNWKVKDYKEFNRRVIMAMAENTIGSFDLAKTVIVAPNRKTTTTRSEVFKKCLRRHGDVENWNKTVDFLEETVHMNPENLLKDGVLEIVNSRYISQNTKDAVVAFQNGKDAIDNEEFAPDDDIEFDHIRSIKNGGKSGLKNIRAIKKEYNREKGCLNGDQYDAARSVA